MFPELAGTAQHQHGLFLRSQALACGYDDEEIRRQVRVGEWTRVRRGAYVETSTWGCLDEAAQHALRARAVLLRVDDPAVLSHCSASAVLQLPTWGVDLSKVHLTRPAVHAGRIRAGVTHHEASLAAVDVIDVDGTPCTSLRRTALDTAREFGFEAGVVCTDAALRRGLGIEALESLAATMTAWPGSRQILPVLGFADGGAESPGESLARMFVVSIGLPRPRTQVVFGRGRFLARVDLWIDELGWAMEFDGRAKYQRRRDPCDAVVDDPDLVWAEKQREDELRSLPEVRAFSRLVWSDLFGVRRQVAATRLWSTAERLGVPLSRRRVA